MDLDQILRSTPETKPITIADIAEINKFFEYLFSAPKNYTPPITLWLVNQNDFLDFYPTQTPRFVYKNNALTLTDDCNTLTFQLGKVEFSKRDNLLCIDNGKLQFIYNRVCKVYNNF